MLEYLSNAIAEGRPREAVFETLTLASVIQAERERMVMDTLLGMLEQKGVFTRDDQNQLRKTVALSMRETEDRLKGTYPTYFEGMNQLEATRRGYARERLRGR